MIHLKVILLISLVSPMPAISAAISKQQEKAQSVGIEKRVDATDLEQELDEYYHKGYTVNYLGKNLRVKSLDVQKRELKKAIWNRNKQLLSIWKKACSEPLVCNL